jgi:formate--tetrahydrofolate ligase
MHGGVAKEDLGNENIEALKKGLENLGRHIRNLGQFGVPAIVAVNEFTGDTKAEFNEIKKYCEALGVKAILCSHWSAGSKGATDLAKEVVALTDDKTTQFRTLYENSMTLWDKTSLIAKSMYGANEVIADKTIREQFKNLQESGYGDFPICMAKTQYSFSTASIDDLHSSLQAFTGINLNDYFDQWIYGSGSPVFYGQYYSVNRFLRAKHPFLAVQKLIP